MFFAEFEAYLEIDSSSLVKKTTKLYRKKLCVIVIIKYLKQMMFQKVVIKGLT